MNARLRVVLIVWKLTHWWKDRKSCPVDLFLIMIIQAHYISICLLYAYIPSMTLAYSVSLNHFMCSLAAPSYHCTTLITKLCASSVKLLEHRLRALEACLELALHPTKSSAKKQRRGSLKRQHSVARSSSTPHVCVDANAKPTATSSTVVTDLPLVNRFSPLSYDLDIPTPEKSSLHTSTSNAEDESPESPESPLPLPPSTTHVKANSNGSQPLWMNPKVKHIWKTTKSTTTDEVTAHIAGLGFDLESFKVERRQSKRGLKEIWFFAVLADSKTILDLAAKWSSSNCPWSIKDPVQYTQSQKNPFLSQSSQPPKPPYHPQPLFNHLPRPPLPPRPPLFLPTPNPPTQTLLLHNLLQILLPLLPHPAPPLN